MIKLTLEAHDFAVQFEGPGALIAKAEMEVERLNAAHAGRIVWVASSFSWHGADNMSLFRSPMARDTVVVDLNVDDDETATLERSREIVRIAQEQPAPLAKETTDG